MRNWQAGLFFPDVLRLMQEEEEGGDGHEGGMEQGGGEAGALVAVGASDPGKGGKRVREEGAADGSRPFLMSPTEVCRRVGLRRL